VTKKKKFDNTVTPGVQLFLSERYERIFLKLTVKINLMLRLRSKDGRGSTILKKSDAF